MLKNYVPHFLFSLAALIFSTVFLGNYFLLLAYQKLLANYLLEYF
jgi:hypothetical protein